MQICLLQMLQLTGSLATSVVLYRVWYYWTFNATSGFRYEPNKRISTRAETELTNGNAAETSYQFT